MEIQKILHEVFLAVPHNRFDAFVLRCQEWYNKPAHTLNELRTRQNKKIKGDIFEEFCVLYLKHCKAYDNVWRLEDVPEEILRNLSLKRRDMGIDLICQKGQTFSAVQCKYKKPTLKKQGVSWKALSTFYSLCMRSGPWESYIVMTNCNYICHVGQKTEKDISISLLALQNITQEQWFNMCGSQPICQIEPSITQEELRQARLKRFANI
jgi:predicted helicase